jgi:hypothetical protein
MIFLYILLALIGIVVVLVLVAPKEFNMSRTIQVNASQEKAFQHLRSLKNFDEWSPWADMDPNQERGYKGTEGEIGSVAWWRGNKQVGEGEQEVMKLVPNSLIATELRFLKPFKAINQSHWAIEADGNGCKVTWGFHADFKPPMNVMMMFFSMEKKLGADFEKGLGRWKKIIEK